MAFNRRSIGRAACVILGLALWVLPQTAYSDTVGTAAAVRPASTGTPPGGAARQLKIGTGIVSRERIQTSGSGSLQLMFNDKSTLTVGPGSDLVIDEFVYSPGKSGGRFATRLTKGALRFVGGEISHTTGATINTPVATLGIRGGAALITHDAVCESKKAGRSGCTRIVCTGGVCSVKSLVDARSLQLKVNQAVEIGSLGAVRFSAASVNLNSVAGGGKGGVTASRKGSGGMSRQSIQQSIDQTIQQQTPEPAPPAPP